MRAGAVLALAACLTPAAGAPCDILGDCVAAHSLVRALYDSYSGPLYRVQRASDNATLDIPLLTRGGFVNASAQDAFCNTTAPPPPSPLPPLGTVLSLRPTAQPSFSFRHCDAQGFITADDAGDDHRFTLVAALSGEANAVSFRSVNFPAWYIAPVATAEPGRLGVVEAPAPAAASWALTPAGPGFELLHSATGLVMGVGVNCTGACAASYAPPAAGVFLAAQGSPRTAWALKPSPPAASACAVRRIFDQSGRGNHLDTAPAGGAAPHPDAPVDAAAFPITVGGDARVPAYGAYFQGRMGYRIDNTSGVARGNEPETIYMIVAGATFNSGCW